MWKFTISFELLGHIEVTDRRPKMCFLCLQQKSIFSPKLKNQITSKNPYFYILSAKRKTWWFRVVIRWHWVVKEYLRWEWHFQLQASSLLVGSHLSSYVCCLIVWLFLRKMFSVSLFLPKWENKYRLWRPHNFFFFLNLPISCRCFIYDLYGR